VTIIPSSGDSISLHFTSDSLLGGRGGKLCPNYYNGEYRIDSLGVVNIDPLRTTLIGCRDSTIFWRYLDILQSTTGIQLVESYLYLYSNYGTERLVYEREAQ
jgi:hypothetical protein